MLALSRRYTGMFSLVTIQVNTNVDHVESVMKRQ